MIEFMNVPRQLVLLREWVKTGDRFCHTRYNDGEFYCMFGLRGDIHRNCDGSRFLKSVGTSLVETFTDIWSKYKKRKVLVGTLLGLDPDVDGCQAFLRWADAFLHGWRDMPFASSDLWVYPQGVDDRRIFDLIDAIRNHPNTVYVSCERNKQVAKWLGSKFVRVPGKDAGEKLKSIVERCREYKDHLFVWSAGFVSKPASWQLFLENGSSHIDAGHLFDGACGPPTRSWMDGHQDGDAPGVGQRRVEVYAEFCKYLKGEVDG